MLLLFYFDLFQSFVFLFFLYKTIVNNPAKIRPPNNIEIIIFNGNRSNEIFRISIENTNPKKEALKNLNLLFTIIQ